MWYGCVCVYIQSIICIQQSRRGKDPEGLSDERLGLTYPNGDAVVIVSSGELDDKLGAGLLLGIVERSKPADHLDAVLGGDLSLPRRLHGHHERGGDDGDDDNDDNDNENDV